jgi:hypothetical protein
VAVAPQAATLAPKASAAARVAGQKEPGRPAEKSPLRHRELTPDQRERWISQLHELGFHLESVLASQALKGLDPEKVPKRLRERLLASEEFQRIVPDQGNEPVSFSPAMVDCPLLKKFQLRIRALIGIDASGAVTSAVSYTGAELPSSVQGCTFKPYVDASGNAGAAVVSYSPFEKR